MTTKLASTGSITAAVMRLAAGRRADSVAHGGVKDMHAAMTVAKKRSGRVVSWRLVSRAVSAVGVVGG
jgi:hypothetical protein